jgi:ABC-type bacteriocin/lantibiotic exporter with double-glycine peptidase domain
MSLWKSRFEKRANSADIHQRKLTLEIDVMSMITLFVSAFPILIVLFMSFHNAEGDVQKLAMLVATAPRQILTIQYLSEIINLFVNLNDKVRRTKQLSANLFFDKDISTFDSRIMWGSISIKRIKSSETKTVIRCFDDVITATNNFENGRFIITGDNGTGKTTLLANIKSKIGEKAYILPSQSRIAFQNDEQERGFSTGEKLREDFKEISLNVCDGSCSVLLLDEWNANLDKENIASINADIDKISKTICVIEALHLPASE